MKKMLKIMAMLLVISAVVFAAGCSDKNADTTAENGSQEEVTDQAPVADENGTQTEDVAADIPADNMTVEDNDSAADNMTVEDNDSAADNMTVEDNDSAADNMTVEDNDSAVDNVTVEDNDSADENNT
ncbi:hypothetical protein [Methanosarcina barkeri]|uniref:Uncharacterized protein n=3 Tax=Methanosarcina barkeri TaxID=2208 RepID=A0A0E3LP66_METBA|nr:hypothetical protein [Methanosarcina barkeri]AKB55986.1 hypothetical protein MSBRM_2988 [Methanosarcina barkeri MS]AKB59465.1 hypothetical protein MSBR2_2949 [Methanosarcina barkeri 227]AKJ40135.1 hypothetical protein MCM1_3148 [Methanosarcina barkeri CM1]